eukprot:TRINITY_DN11693_c1_g1_i1.p1 TRINITY_DN11693_c1_g1~~TRINITY_DN11693_c1_g1_i1.p1  ORF type:complete len:787 (+),score=337.41 TRINITY_DN11693_c1_g1_i1:39-2363(+)
MGGPRKVVKKKRGVAGAEKTVLDRDEEAPVAAKPKRVVKRVSRSGAASGTSTRSASASSRKSAKSQDVDEDEEDDVPDMGPQADEDDDAPGDEESFSSDDEQGQLVRTGDVPLAWYKDEDHAGYDVEGNKIIKKTKDALQTLISKFDDPQEMITVYGKLLGEGHKLTPEDLQVLLNLQKNKYPDPHYDPYTEAPVFINWEQNPFDKGCPPKSRFTPSKHEAKIVAKLVRKLRRMEKYPQPPKPDPNAEFLLWNDDDDDEEPDNAALRRRKFQIGPPKPELPRTDESYNPPLEYLPSEDQKAAIMAEEPIDRPDYIAQKFDALRHVPFYRNALRERYQRCLDLFSFTRKKKEKVVIDPDSLLPDLPKPEELRPYPQRLGFVYKGHTGPVRRVSVNHNGQYLATACDDHFARVFEVNTGRLVMKWNLRAPVSCVGWNPDPTLNILAMSADKVVTFAVPTSCACDAVNEASVEALRAGLEAAKRRKEREASTPAADAVRLVSMMKPETTVDEEEDANKELLGELDAEVAEDDAGEKDLVEWLDTEDAEIKRGVVVKAVHHFRIKNFAWHNKGDYIATLCPRDIKKRQIILMQLSVRSSLSPFRRFKEPVQGVMFHPNQPYLLVTTRRSVRVYNLVQSLLVKKLKGTVDSLSGVDVHPDGDNIIVGSHDGPLMWYDMDWGDRPYKKLTSQKSAVHSARFHPQTSVYPLFASAGDSGQIHVFHGRVYDDYNTNPLLVPLKIIKGHKVTGSVGVLHLAFHPTLPWLFSAAADGTVKCWTE